MLAVLSVALLMLSLSASASAPRSYFDLTVLIDRSQVPKVRFDFDLQDPLWYAGSNDTYLAEYVNISVALGPELTLDGKTPGGSWNATAMNVLQNVTFHLYANVSAAAIHSSTGNASSPIFATMTVFVNYTDVNGNYPRTLVRSLTFPINYVSPPPPPVVALLPAAVLGVGSAGAVGIGLFVVRRARLEELYLMHDSGVLIRHWSRSSGLLHDSDIMSGMLIVLQEYVRDTWKTHNDENAFLQQLRFGPQRVVLARGQHTLLAAVVEGRYLNGLPRKLQKAVQEFERANADVLSDWNGNVDLFPHADEIARRFLRTPPSGTT